MTQTEAILGPGRRITSHDVPRTTGMVPVVHGDEFLEWEDKQTEAEFWWASQMAKSATNRTGRHRFRGQKYGVGKKAGNGKGDITEWHLNFRNFISHHELCKGVGVFAGVCTISDGV